MKPIDVDCPVCGAPPTFSCEVFVKEEYVKIPETHKARKRAAASEILRQKSVNVQWAE